MITRRNPASIAKPIGRYHHGVQVPPNARVLYISGQLGMNPDGTAETTPAGQIERVFQNILEILKDNDMGPENLRASIDAIPGLTADERAQICARTAATLLGEHAA